MIRVSEKILLSWIQRVMIQVTERKIVLFTSMKAI